MDKKEEEHWFRSSSRL